MKTIEEIRKTPVGLLTADEIRQLQLDPSGKIFSRTFLENLAKEKACPGHEKVGTGLHEDARRGWHPGRCKHCGTDMSVDSGD